LSFPTTALRTLASVSEPTTAVYKVNSSRAGSCRRICPSFIPVSKNAMARRRSGSSTAANRSKDVTSATLVLEQELLQLDAALRGFRTALVEKGDFGGATSSRSSRLVHGGLRYLETGVYDDETQRAVVRMLLAFSLRLQEYIEESRPGERWC